MRRVIQTLTLCVACILQCGCLLNHSNHVVLRQDEPLRSLTFESEVGRNQFEASVSASMNDDSNQSSASFGVPFIVGVAKTKTVSSNGVRNDVAALFDVNGDSHISDYEVSLRCQNSPMQE